MKRSGQGRRTVKSDETLFAIIEHLKASDGAGVTELAEHLDLAKSTVHKHLTTLEQNRYVVNEDGRYRLGLGFFNTGVYVRNQYDVYHAARERLERLAAETGEAVWLVVHENGMGMFVYGVSHNESFTFDSTVGNWVHLHSNSAGKSILAHLPEDDVEEILDQHGLPERTENTITDRDVLFDEFETIRERGYATNFQEDVRGLRAIGTAIFRDGRPIAGVTVAGAANRFTRERIDEELTTALGETVDDIELGLVYG